MRTTLSVFLAFFLLQSCISIKEYKNISNENAELKSKVLSLSINVENLMPYITDTALLKSYDSLKVKNKSLQIQNRELQTIVDNNSRRTIESSFYGFSYADSWGIAKLQVKASNNSGVDYMISENEFEKYMRFPIPPPRPTRKITLSDSIFGKDLSIHGIDSTLKVILKRSNNQEVGYFSLSENNGIAIVLPVQEFDPSTGKSIREFTKPKPSSIWWKVFNYLEQITSETKGYYRLTAFVVSNKSFSFDGELINLQNAKSLESKALNYLDNPPEPTQKNYHCYLLIYEFEKTENNKNPNCVVDSDIPVKLHLQSLNLQ